VLDRIDSHLIAAPGIIIIIQLYAGLIILIWKIFFYLEQPAALAKVF
jgi:hypothetical protein